MGLIRDINPNIFREYDVRGKYPEDINESVAYIFGRAYGTYIKRFIFKRNVTLFEHGDKGYNCFRSKAL